MLQDIYEKEAGVAEVITISFAPLTWGLDWLAAMLLRPCSLADCGGRLDMDDNCVLEIDEVVGGIGEEGPIVACRCPARGRIRDRQLLGRRRGRSTEGGTVEHGNILANGMAGGRVRQGSCATHSMLAVNIGAHEAVIDREAFAANQSLGNAARHSSFEQLAQTSLSRKRPHATLDRFFEKVEWSGTSPSCPRRQNQR